MHQYNFERGKTECTMQDNIAFWTESKALEVERRMLEH